MCAKNMSVEALPGLGAVRRSVAAADVGLMLAEPRDRAFSRAGWIFEIKYDGFRVLAGRQDGRPFILYRHGIDAAAVFPEITRAIDELSDGDVIIDGEIVVLDHTGRPSFQRMQRRALLTRAPDIERMAVELPATLFAFDFLAAGAFDLRGLPLTKRKELLRDLLSTIADGRPLRYTDHVEEEGEALFESAREMRLEGIVGKRGDAPYRAGRSSDWVKMPVNRTGDFAIVGMSPPKGSRAGFGALHLAGWDAGELAYAGRVGTGFSDKQLAELTRALQADRRATPPCRDTLPADRRHTWVTPRLVCEVRFREWTDERLLRQPAFLRMRPDKTVDDCERLPTREGAAAAAEAAASATTTQGPSPGRTRDGFRNLDKVFWPQEGYTKGDLINYYEAVAPWLLPYLADRPLVLTRFPDGVTGKSFFQKDAPDHVPSWIRTERIHSDSVDRDIDYFICDNAASLLYLANLGTIPLHVWSSRVGDLEHPDWCILDLDPKTAPFADVITIALAARALCDEIGLPSYPKTSGGSGLHVLLPLGGQATHDESRSLGQLMAGVIAAELPAIATVERAIPARRGRVYIDFLQNGHGKTIAAPLSARPVPGARVSMPVPWKDVGPRLDPARFTIRTAPALLRRRKEDLLADVLRVKPDLGSALTRLGERLRPRAGRAT